MRASRAAEKPCAPRRLARGPRADTRLASLRIGATEVMRRGPAKKEVPGDDPSIPQGEQRGTKGFDTSAGTGLGDKRTLQPALPRLLNPTERIFTKDSRHERRPPPPSDDSDHRPNDRA